jgi:hypothetical protein
VKAGSALTITTFPDGSVLTLDAGSEARVDFANGRPVFQLLKGVARFSLKSLLAVELEAGSKIVTPKELTGTLSLGGIRPAAVGFWTVGTTVAVLVGAGAAAGAGVGIAEAVKGGSSVSPSQ